MKQLGIFLLILAGTQSAFAGAKVVYGQDDREDLYEVTNDLHLKLAQSTAGMIHSNYLVPSAASGYFDIQGHKTLGEAKNLCPSVKFSEQSRVANCSGFLVGPDTLVTAGHCFVKPDVTPEERCKDYKWIFNFELESASSDPTRDISADDVYSCESVVATHTESNIDFAVIKLDRKVVGREPLQVRRKGKINQSASLVVIGHPNGIPKKISAKGRILDNSSDPYFTTNLDTFTGNSGAAVFDAKTGLVEGILAYGEADYVPSISGDENSCQVINECDENAVTCKAERLSFGEIVLRIEKVVPSIIQAWEM